MPKSNYPNKLDTSVEIPKVRDNVTEIGSDVLNSLRSAIFNIERTLGVNPQGVAGQTLASRLSNLIDENGYIKKEALLKAGILNGPVSGKDISKTAGIEEFKLNLDYPTQLLQDEISIANTKIDQFIKALEELNRIISIHVDLRATNRHGALAITVNDAELTPSDVALADIQAQDLQSFIESLFNSHINYSGIGISEGNRSHKANQIFFDNSSTSDLIFSDDVQGAIDDLAGIEGTGLRSSILNLNSNGRIRTGSKVNAYEGGEFGREIVPASPVNYSDYSGDSRSTISFTSNPTPLEEIKKFDILKISNSFDESDNKQYLISSVNLESDGTLISVEIFDGPKFEFLEGTTASIKKSSISNYNQNGLNAAVRPRALYTNNPVIQVSLPNSATIVSSGARFEKLESGLYEFLAIKVDEEETYNLPLYNSDYARQNIDTAVASINRFCASNNLNIFAYKIKVLNCYEMAISHNIPDTSEDIKLRSLRVVAADSFDASEKIGMSYLLDRQVTGAFGNNFHINGVLSSEFGKVKSYSGNAISLISGLTEIESGAANFLQEGIRVGDLCIIDGSSNTDDNGTYLVTNVLSNKIQLDYTGNTFSGSLDENSIVFFTRSCAPITELDFLEPSSSILIDVFADDELNIHYHRRADISGEIYLPNFYAIISDISSGFITEGSEYSLIIGNNGNAYLKNNLTLNEGSEVFVGSSGEHKVFSENGMEFVTLKCFVPDESSDIFPAGTHSLTIYGKSELSQGAYPICRSLFSPEFGIVIDDISSGLGGIGAPSVIDKRRSGTVDDTIISEAFIERYIWGPRNELRSSGVIRSGSVTNLANGSGSCTIDIDPGIFIVNGSRFEYQGDIELPYNYSGGSTNNFYIGINNHGCIVIGNEVDKTGGTNYVSPFSYETVLHIAYVDIDGSVGDTEEIYDLRFFIDRSDYKLSKEIIVSKNQNFGHFTSIESAINYCRLFTNIYKDLNSPGIFIKEGTYEVGNVIVLDFDISIRGSGPSTILKRSAQNPLSATTLLSTDSADYFIQIGTSYTDNIENGISLSDFTYMGIDDQDSAKGGVVFRIFHNTRDNPDLAYFKFSNIRFLAADDYSVPNQDDLSAGIGPNELPFYIGSGASHENIFQNIIIQNCYSNQMGYQKGLIYLHPDNSYRNISVSNFISEDTLDVAYSVIELGTSGGPGSNISNVQETNSMITNI